MKKRQIEISEETYEKLKDQLIGCEMKEINSLDDFIGEKLFIRTVTYHLIGKVEKQIGTLLYLKNTVWVADSGRFMNAIKEGTLNEVEPIGDWFVNTNAIVDMGIWKHDIPTKQK